MDFPLRAVVVEECFGLRFTDFSDPFFPERWRSRFCGPLLISL